MAFLFNNYYINELRFDAFELLAIILWPIAIPSGVVINKIIVRQAKKNVVHSGKIRARTYK